MKWVYVSVQNSCSALRAYLCTCACELVCACVYVYSQVLAYSAHIGACSAQCGTQSARSRACMFQRRERQRARTCWCCSAQHDVQNVCVCVCVSQQSRLVRHAEQFAVPQALVVVIAHELLPEARMANQHEQPLGTRLEPARELLHTLLQRHTHTHTHTQAWVATSGLLTSQMRYTSMQLEREHLSACARHHPCVCVCVSCTHSPVSVSWALRLQSGV